MTQRLLLCTLVSLALIYVAVPRLPIGADGLAGVFSLMWLCFALIVFGGNLTGLLYSKKQQTNKQFRPITEQETKKLRRYNR